MNTLTRLVILVALPACFACVFYLTLNHRVGAYGVETDLYLFYAPTAQALENGQIKLDDFHPPLYGWLIGLLTLTRLFPGEFEVSLLLSVLSYGAVVLLIWRIARHSFAEDETIGWLAVAIAASNPTLMEFACRADVHIFYLALSLASIYFCLRKNVWLTGLCVALAIWTRYTWMLSIIPLFFLPRKKALPGWGLAAVAWIALGILTLVYKGSWLYSLNHISFAAGLYNTDLPTNPGLWDQLHQAEFEHKSLIGILLYNPLLAAKSIFTHLGLYPYKALIYLMVFPTGLLAVLGLRKKYWGSYRHPLIFWTLGFFAILVLTFWFGYYALGLIPLLSLAAAVQLADLPFPRLTSWISPVIVAGLAIWGGITVSRVMTPGPIAEKQAAAFMRELPGKTVVSRDPRVFYYSGKQPGRLYLRPDSSVQVEADYIFASNYEVSLNDTLLHILNESNFEKRCDNLNPWPNDYVKILRLKPEVINPRTP
jgi:hypothetical protein